MLFMTKYAWLDSWNMGGWRSGMILNHSTTTLYSFDFLSIGQYETLRIAFSMHRPSLFCALYRATLYILNKRLVWIFTFLRILTKENSCTRFHICSKRRFQKMFNFFPKMSARTMGSLKSFFLGPKIFTRNHNDLESQKNNLFKKNYRIAQHHMYVHTKQNFFNSSQKLKYLLFVAQLNSFLHQ